jgi:hypothetical protein
MKIFNDTLRRSGLAGLFVVLAVLSTSCSDSGQNGGDKRPTAAQTQFDHTHGREVSDLEKHKFEHDFAEQCIEREIARSTNKEADRARFAKPCMCIAQYMMKDLTAKEAQKFLKEHKNTQSLQIRFENAAYHCLQQKAQPKAPTIFHRR